MYNNILSNYYSKLSFNWSILSIAIIYFIMQELSHVGSSMCAKRYLHTVKSRLRSKDVRLSILASRVKGPWGLHLISSRFQISSEDILLNLRISAFRLQLVSKYFVWCNINTNFIFYCNSLVNYNDTLCIDHFLDSNRKIFNIQLLKIRNFMGIRILKLAFSCFKI